jgi:hypothetical protein
MPPEIVLYALADVIVLFMLVLIALTAAVEEPRLETRGEDDHSERWLMVPCWLI